jgi:hypothetical protein
MSLTQEKEIENLVRARYPLLQLISWEEERAERLLRQLAENGVTPELMDHLRTFVTKVKYRSDPTDGDISFWKTVGTMLVGE